MKKALYIILAAVIVLAVFLNFKEEKSQRVKRIARLETKRVEVSYEARITDEQLENYIRDDMVKLKQGFDSKELSLLEKILSILKKQDYSKKLNVDDERLSFVEIYNQVNVLIEKLKANEFDYLENFFEECLENQRLNSNGIFEFAHYHYLISEDLTVLEYLNKWCKEIKDSSFARSIRSRWYIEIAWRVRGGGWAHTVKESQWKGFGEYLELAKQDNLYAYKFNKNNFMAPASMITVMMGLNESYDKQIIWFERAMESNYLHANIYPRLGMSLLSRWGGNDDLVRYFYGLLNLAPEFTGRTNLQYSKILLSQKKSEVKSFDSLEAKVAEAIILNYLQEFSYSPSGFERLARLAWIQDRDKEAIQYLSDALDKGESDTCYALRGDYYYKYSEKSNLSRNDYNSALKINKDNLDAWDGLANLNYYVYQNDKEAIRCYDMVLKYDPTDYASRRRRADCHRFIGNFDFALKEYNIVIANQPDDANCYVSRGALHLIKKRISESEADFKKAISLRSSLADRVESIKSKYK